MKMRTLRKLRTLAPRKLRPYEFDITDATIEQDTGPPDHRSAVPPEAVFDRLTGPFDHRRRGFASPGAADEET